MFLAPAPAPPTAKPCPSPTQSRCSSPTPMRKTKPPKPSKPRTTTSKTRVDRPNLKSIHRSKRYSSLVYGIQFLRNLLRSDKIVLCVFQLASPVGSEQPDK